MDKILKIYHSILRGDLVTIDAKQYSSVQLEKFAIQLGTNLVNKEGKIIIKNSNYISDDILRYLSIMSKQKIEFEF